jgi:hypothetical protein
MGIFAGDRPIIVGVLTAIGVEQGVLYWRYRRHIAHRGRVMSVRYRMPCTTWIFLPTK